MMASSESRKKQRKNRQRLGGNGLSLQAFANAKSQSSYNPHLIKKQRELYKNAKLIKKYKKSVKQQNFSEDHGLSISIPEIVEANNIANKNIEIVRNNKKKKKKNSLQNARQEYEKRQEEEEKARAGREALIRATEEEKARTLGRRKALRVKMFKRTQSGQPIMKHRIGNLLQAIQKS